MAQVKADGTIKADKDYKAGEDIKLTGATVDAHDEDINGLVKDRLERQAKSITEKLTTQHQADLAKLKDEKAGGDVSKETTERIQKLENELKLANVEKSIDKVLRDMGAADLDPIFRDRIKPQAGMTSDEIENEIKGALSARDAYNKKHGIEPGKGAGEEKKVEETLGFGGSGGTMTKSDSTTLATLEAKLLKNRPELRGMIANETQGGKLKLLQKYEAAGHLEPKTKK